MLWLAGQQNYKWFLKGSQVDIQRETGERVHDFLRKSLINLFAEIRDSALITELPPGTAYAYFEKRAGKTYNVLGQ